MAATSSSRPLNGSHQQFLSFTWQLPPVIDLWVAVSTNTNNSCPQLKKKKKKKSSMISSTICLRLHMSVSEEGRGVRALRIMSFTCTNNLEKFYLSANVLENSCFCPACWRSIGPARRRRRFESPVQRGIFLPASTFGTDSLTVFVHPRVQSHAFTSVRT